MDDASALGHLKEFLHGNGLRCPRCGCADHYWLASRKVYKCKQCYRQFSIFFGTPFHAHKLAPRQILSFVEAWCAADGEMSGKETERLLSVDYKSAWRLVTEMRLFMKQRNEVKS